MMIILKFFEFNDYDYYGLVVADDIEKAITGYDEVVSEIDEEEKHLVPDELTLDEALEKYKKGMIEGCETEEEKIEDFNQSINKYKELVEKGIEQYLVLLVDSSLV